MAKLIVAYGTRPERIKLAPVVTALRSRGHEVTEWCSGQHEAIDAEAMGAWFPKALLAENVGITMGEMACYLAKTTADAVIVQGDTATAMACAQASFLARVPVAHVEAGLRTYADEPWPEEAFRRQIAAVARWHFCPDEAAADNVVRENNRKTLKGGFGALGVGQMLVRDRSNIFVTGNTAIDALPSAPLRVLVTLHRRENWGARRFGALEQLNSFAEGSDAFVYIVRHPNWNQDGVDERTCGNLLLLDPMSHNRMVESLRTMDAIVTDSGGLQEEAAHFGIPCLVVRTATERTALLNAGAVTLIDPDSPTELYDALSHLLARRRCYGDGTAALQIADILTQELSDGT